MVMHETESSITAQMLHAIPSQPVVMPPAKELVLKVAWSACMPRPITLHHSRPLHPYHCHTYLEHVGSQLYIMHQLPWPMTCTDPQISGLTGLGRTELLVVVVVMVVLLLLLLRLLAL